MYRRFTRWSWGESGNSEWGDMNANRKAEKIMFQDDVATCDIVSTFPVFVLGVMCYEYQ